MPAISVIVPVYKVEKYIHRCVDSILSQTFRDFELILVDDGSPDNCPAICDEYAAKDSRIRVIHQKNGGLSAARNAGLDCSCGAFIVFVDSDDWLREDSLEVLVNRQQQTGADLVLCNILPVYPQCHTGWRRPATPLKEEILTQGQLLNGLASQHNWYYCVAWNKLYKRQIFDALRFPLGYIHEDEALIHRITDRCARIAVTDQVLYFYRQTDQSITGLGLRIQSTDKLQAYADRICFCAEKGWQELMEVTMAGYIDAFLHLYFRFPRTRENEIYFQRMEAGLKMVLPFILNAGSVSLRHKLYLAVIRINPKIYSAMKRLLKGEQENVS